MARTVTINPIQTSRVVLGPPGLDPIDEDEPSTPRSPSYSGFPSPTIRAFDSPTRRTFDSPTRRTFDSPIKRSFDSPPQTTLNSPRKLSNSSTTSTMYSRESVRSEMVRTSSWGSKTSFGSQTVARPRKPEEVFAALPGEILELVLEMLKRTHLGKGSDSCATCWMWDLCNISRSSRKWNKFARVALYEDIQLVGLDSATHKKKFKMVLGTRVLMLRQTLRSNPHLATLVRSLKVPRADPTAKGNNAKALEQYEDLVATLVMACPNLERLSGPMVGYDHSFKKIFHALSTRGQMREIDWLIEPSALQGRKGSTSSLSRTNSGFVRTDSGLVTPGELELSQLVKFLDHHRNWPLLSSLSIHCLPGSSMAPDTLLTRTLSMLPSLQHLHLCNLPTNAFNDAILLSLPPLQTLSLTHITGITSTGLSSFATCAASQPLRRLHLRHTPLTSLPALARILSNLTSLTTFSLAQAFPPLMPEADSFALWMMPYLASATVRKLHWDITSHRDCATVADDILARSIAAGGFPQLKLLRTPNDPEAIFQDLCRPVEAIDLPTDRFRSDETPSTPIDAPPPSPVRNVFRSPKSPVPQSPSGSMKINYPPQCTDLRIARLAAQSRLERARSKPRFAVTVTAEDGSPVQRFNMGGYLGTVGSKIDYYLLPDEGSSDEKGGVVDVRDFAGDAGESLTSGREGCVGVWNRKDGVVADKKEKERWWHTERGRWSRVELL